MLFAIHCLDKPGVLERRMQALPAHRDYLDNSDINVVMSGPLVEEDDDSKIIGGMYVLEADDRATLDEILKNDPLVQADIWETVNIHPFIKRVG